MIIVNLAYLGWATLIDVPDEVTPSASSTADPSVQRLILVSERSNITAAAAVRSQKARADRTTAATTPSTNTTGDKSGSQCISVGPFQDLTSAAQASATLKSAGRESRQRLEQGQLWFGYRVTVPGFAKREDAERAVARLKQNGIADVYISLSTADAESAHVVSVGVFQEAEGAQRRLAETKNLGLAAQISDHTRAGSVYWVDVDLAASEPNSVTNFDFSSLGAQPGKILRLEQRACPSANR